MTRPAPAGARTSGARAPARKRRAAVAIETLILAQPVIQGRGRTVAAPFQFLVTGEDHLRVRSFCSVAGVRLSVDMRFATTDGVVTANGESHVPKDDRTEHVTVIALTTGYVLNLVVRASAGTPKIGQCYVIVDVIRGLGSSARALGQMLGGYVSSAQGLAWPGSPIESSLTGQGCPTKLSAGVPGSVQLHDYIVPAGAVWEMITYKVTMFTGGLAGDRPVSLYVLADDGVVLFALVQAGPVPPSSSALLTWGQGLPVLADVPIRHYTTGLPHRVVLKANYTIRVVNNNFLFSDTFIQPTLYCQEWLEAAS